MFRVSLEVAQLPFAGDRGRVAFLILLEVEQDLLGAGVSEDAFEHADRSYRAIGRITQLLGYITLNLGYLTRRLGRRLVWV